MREGAVVGPANHTILIGKDGTERPIDDSAAPIHGPAGRIVGCVLVFRDISDRRRREESIRLAGEQMRSVVNTVVDGIITIDQGGIVETFNPAAERLFGFEAAEVIGQNVKMLMPEPYHGEHDRYIADYLRTGQPKVMGFGREVVGRRKDGSTFPSSRRDSGSSSDPTAASESACRWPGGSSNCTGAPSMPGARAPAREANSLCACPGWWRMRSRRPLEGSRATRHA